MEAISRPPASVRVVGLFGPSGAGKTTLARLLPALWPDRYEQVVTISTRSPRPDDLSSYRHVERDVFDRMLRAGDFLAWTEIRSASERRFYAYRREDLEAAARRSRIVIAPVERHLTEQLRTALAPAGIMVIGLRPPGATVEEQLAALRARLAPRYRANPEALEDRLANARDEDLPFADGFPLDAAVATTGSERETAQLLDGLIQARFGA